MEVHLKMGDNYACGSARLPAGAQALERENGPGLGLGGVRCLYGRFAGAGAGGRAQTPKAMAESAILRIKSGEGINLVPFRTIAGFFKHFIPDIFLVNIVGNIVMFMPWGFGLLLLWKKRQRFFSAAAYSLALPVLIEACQLFTGRSVDVDDLLLNFLGGCLGAGVYLGVRKLAPGVGKLAL